MIANKGEQRMNNMIEQYLKELGAGRVLVERVEAAVRAYTFLCGSGPEQIFVCNTIDPETGDQRHASIWGFHEEFWMEARDDGLGWDVDISSYAGGIYYLGIQYKGIELPDGISEHSRLSVEIRTDKVEYNSMSAIGLNCRALLDIVNTRFRPNLAMPLVSNLVHE